MTAHRGIVRGLLAIAVAVNVVAAEEDPTTLFRQAVAQAERGDKARAIELMDQVSRLSPDAPNVFWNLGIWKAEVGDHAGALQCWLRYRELEPSDWMGRAKVIQAHQALHQTELVEKERAALLALAEQGNDPELAKADRYCREQMKVAGRQVMVFEFFRPTGERRVFYRFSILGKDGKEAYWYSLGSYDSTVRIAWETGEVPRDKRLHHLDRYASDSHATVGFYSDMPGYEVVRQRVIAAIEEEVSLETPQPSAQGAAPN